MSSENEAKALRDGERSGRKGLKIESEVVIWNQRNGIAYFNEEVLSGRDVLSFAGIVKLDGDGRSGGRHGGIPETLK